MLVASINEWGRRVDASLGLLMGSFSDLRGEVVGTQVVLANTIQEAKTALTVMHEGFRQALDTSSASQRFAVEALISHARAKFLELEAKLEVLNTSAQQTMALTEQWALGEGARTASQIAGAAGLRVPPGADLGTSAASGSPPASPRLDAWARQDPWGGAASSGPAPRMLRGGASFEPYPGPQAAPQTAQQPAPQMAQQPTSWPVGGREPREFRIDARGWAHQKALEAGMAPEAFQVWRERALGHLSQGRQDVRRLLVWAEAKSASELEAGAAAKVRELGVVDFVQVDFALHGAIMLTISDSLLGRARCCDEHGLLLWRNLCAEWAGSAPQYRLAKARQFQDPVRAKDFAALWTALPAWERLGEEVRTAGFECAEWMRSAALEKLLPLDLLRIVVSRFSTDGRGT